MDFLKTFAENIESKPCLKSTNHNYEIQKVSPKNLETFLNHLKLVIPFFCEHPHSILEEIEKLREDGLESIVKYLHKATKNNTRVWNGTIGEAIATCYILSSTDYKIPVFKLRFATNRTMAMHGDDVLGMKFNADGTPQKLLVVEVKNYGANPKQAVEKASDGLLKVQQGSITLLGFIINILKTKDRLNEAKQVKRFNDPYNYSYHTEYLAFIVTQESKWKDEYFDAVVDGIKPPLIINAFLIPNWIEDQKQLVLPEDNKTPTKITLPDVEINELEDLRKLLDNRTFKNEHNQLASEALSIDLKNQQRKSTPYKYNPIKLEKSANFLASTGYNLLDDSSEEAEKVLKEAAVIHERLAIVRLEDGQKFPAVDNIITSALLYSLAGYNANAKVLVSKILCHQDIQDSLSSDTPRILLAYLLNGEIIKIQDRLAQFFYQFPQNKLEEVEEFPKEEEEWMYWVSEKISSIGDYLTAKVFAYFIHYLRTGNKLYKSEIIKLTIAAGKQYATIGNYRSYVLLSSIRRYLENLIENSTQNLVRSNLVDIQEEWKLYLRFLSTLGKFPMMSMWKSQRKALQEGLLEDKYLIIAMPTSAGKTKTVEIAIYKALKNNPDKICAYVVPTRALAYEVESSLSVSLSRVNINVSILYGGYDFSQLEEDVLQDNQVFVLTPEKLDLLTRSNDLFKNKLALIIIDEVHDSAAANLRSMRQELTYSRLLAIAERNKIRVIGISAVINNAGDFAKWLCNDENNVIEIDWRPTKQRLGYIKWVSGRARVQYLVQTDDYPTDDFFIQLPFVQSQCKKKGQKGGSYIDSNFVAARLAIYYSKTGSTLVFTTTKPLVESIAKCLIQIQENEQLVISLQMQNIANELAEILGDNHLLVKSINHGFCYHHSELPSTVRRKVENAVRANIIPLIISTTTLSQGVNLPIKNVIVHSLSMHGIISMTQYKNAVGRAGRAGAETEGHIIFCAEKDLERVQQEETTEKSESFLMSGIKNLVKLRLLSVDSTEDFLSLWATSSTSQFRKNSDNYETWTKQMQTKARKSQAEILSYLDSQILAWILETCIDEVDEEKIEVIFKRLLCNVQSLEIQSILAEFKEALKARAISLKESLPDIQKRQLFNITGLGVDSNQLITEYAHKLVKEIDKFNNLSDLPREFWQETYNIFKEITELKQDLHLDNGIDPLIGWLDGKDYKELADLYFDGNSEIVVKKLEKVIHAFAWGFNSLISHINFYLNLNGKKIPNIFKSLTSFITHGVSNTAAVYAISLGVHDRQIAIALSTTYQLAFPQIEYTHFKRWLFTLSFEQWKDIAHVEDENISKIEEHFKNVQTKQQKLEKNTNIFDCSLIKINDFIITNGNVEKDDLIIVSFDENLYLTTYEYKFYCQLDGEKIERLKQFDRQVYDFVIDDIDQQRETVSIVVY
ncbi:Hachiman antiphage defense system protein HamA [Dolichospermum heterosporum]|uniref:SAVED domain-containing protein n=1 Tax=Dolichospermum heterosporum TAC447 TaxID=747523 RepID=A0ABY5LS85_9CYAN|nr:Hachiman antiphage defense system protein HamA [Dolichospermum heterosporum]UUO13602.1 SAVED domain-containing protein [Dolichospermum heterosporum TAC447]